MLNNCSLLLQKLLYRIKNETLFTECIIKRLKLRTELLITVCNLVKQHPHQSLAVSQYVPLWQVGIQRFSEGGFRGYPITGLHFGKVHSLILPWNISEHIMTNNFILTLPNQTKSWPHEKFSWFRKSIKSIDGGTNE